MKIFCRSKLCLWTFVHAPHSTPNCIIIHILMIYCIYTRTDNIPSFISWVLGFNDMLMFCLCSLKSRVFILRSNMRQLPLQPALCRLQNCRLRWGCGWYDVRLHHMPTACRLRNCDHNYGRKQRWSLNNAKLFRHLNKMLHYTRPIVKSLRDDVKMTRQLG